MEGRKSLTPLLFKNVYYFHIRPIDPSIFADREKRPLINGLLKARLRLWYVVIFKNCLFLVLTYWGIKSSRVNLVILMDNIFTYIMLFDIMSQLISERYKRAVITATKVWSSLSLGSASIDCS